MLVLVLWCCVWCRGWEGAMAPAPLSAGFQSLPLLPTSKLGLSGADSWVGGLVYILGPVGLSNELSCEARSFSRCCHNPHGCFQSEVWGFISPRWNSGLLHLLPGLSASASAGQLQLCPLCSTIHCLAGSSSCHLARSPLHPAARLHPSYWSGWMFLLYLLGCRTSIQFDFLSVLTVFVFKLLLSFFWLCEEAQCVYLRLHLGWKSRSRFLKKWF